MTRDHPTHHRSPPAPSPRRFCHRPSGTPPFLFSSQLYPQQQRRPLERSSRPLWQSPVECLRFRRRSRPDRDRWPGHRLGRMARRKPEEAMEGATDRIMSVKLLPCACPRRAGLENSTHDFGSTIGRKSPRFEDLTSESGSSPRSVGSEHWCSSSERHVCDVCSSEKGVIARL